MSVHVESQVVDRGMETFVDDAWELKEQIRREDGVLRQRRGFFRDAYRRSRVFVYVDHTRDQLIGFAAVRSDGYLLFLAVAIEYRGHGFGKRLIAHVTENHPTVSCHARSTNQAAIGFYRHLGFSIRKRLDNYYEDGGDAFYLTLGSDSIRSKLSDLLRS